jgi:hypothetical protein
MTTIPLTFSECEFNEAGGDIDSDPPVFPDEEITIYLRTLATIGGCATGPGGGDFPGAFGWLDSGDDCEMSIQVGDIVPADTGIEVPPGCALSEWQDADVVIPVFDTTHGAGEGGGYHISAFVGFHITGFRFPEGSSDNRWPAGFSCDAAPGGSSACIRGYFTRITTNGGGFGDGDDYGVRVIKMIG